MAAYNNSVFNYITIQIIKKNSEEWTQEWRYKKIKHWVKLHLELKSSHGNNGYRPNMHGRKLYSKYIYAYIHANILHTQINTTKPRSLDKGTQKESWVFKYCVSVWGMAQVVEDLPTKHQVQVSSANTSKSNTTNEYCVS